MKNKYEIRGDVTAIFLNRKDGTIIETLINTIDLEKVSSFPNTWVSSYSKSTKSYYAIGHHGPAKARKTVHLHRIITDCPDSMVTDHINWDTLDNTRENLRVLTQSENLKHKKKSSTSYTGIYFKNNKWLAFSMSNRKQTYVGMFDSKDEAIEAKSVYESIGLSAKKSIRRNGEGSVHYRKEKKRWIARKTVDGKQKHIGTYLTKFEAEESLKKAFNGV